MAEDGVDSLDDLSETPVRDRFQEVTEKIPEGPMGKVGGGNLIGAAGYTAVSATRPILDFIPGIRQPGFTVTAHGTKQIGPNHTRHIIVISALSEKVAEFVAEYNAAPSNIDYLRSEIRLVELKELQRQRTYTIYQMTVDVITKEILE